MRKIAVLIITITVILTSGCSFNKKNDISEVIAINLDNCMIETENDTHGGFLGDGDYFARIKCFDVNYDELSSNWKKLPLTNNIQKITDVKMCDNHGCNNIYEKYFIPKIANGYYYFVDRHSESSDKYDDTNLNNRSSYNFTLALLDSDTNNIYYYELDT